MNTQRTTQGETVFRSRYQVCDDCECVTIVQRNDARGVPDEAEWDQFPGCMVCGGSMFHWDADEKAQDDVYWAKGKRAAASRVDSVLEHLDPDSLCSLTEDALSQIRAIIAEALS